ncbi:MAG: protein translocase subunit SecD [Gammaproteobacteria bacterium]|nr:protein translocase subunit SecD [Gammaproteobacteria bacterium]MCW8840062.1 protein translocase subunit SecD [Gammaproteobacteria bacterium]MCW8972753.1 protein translocase subunit SecD [Gammaproteobacteria bacterium]MCW8994036.1 protein translocase subunit SecD [Gammaproteobacteria bacterium]
MLNRYPLWKYLLIAFLILVGVIYALPNLYGDDPALQISANRMAEINNETRDRVIQVLEDEQLSYKTLEITPDALLVRFADTGTQLKAYQPVREALGSNYTTAMNLAPATPDWLRQFNALPMYLGLDLRGGVHFLMEVDMDAAISQANERYVSDIRALLREDKVRYLTISAENNRVEVRFRDAAEQEKAYAAIRKEYRDLVVEEAVRDGNPYLYASISEKEQLETKKFAVKQNITTLRKRVNELGVAEPVIQQQGDERIVVQLPGVQDTARAKDVLGATATLEYRMVDEENDLQDALAGRVPFGSRLYRERNGQPILLQKRVIVTGDQIIDAASGIDQQSGSPQVSVTLDAKGARQMLDNTRENVGKRMAVVFIETKTETKMVDGEPKRETTRTEEVISVAVIRGVFSKRFQTTGLDSMEEAHNLALLLRAGALAAPMEIVEERTIGPSMGKENIDKGTTSVVLGFVFVLAFMALWYKGFGLVANMALALNLVFIVAVLSLLQATLTLPGIAGIVLTVGMAVDANVLIFERIREELYYGNTPQAAIHAGYEKAFSTIADANITTLIAAVVLFGFGTGPIKGFAITLSIGIITSMFTAIMVTRGVVNLTVGGKRLSKLSI